MNPVLCLLLIFACIAGVAVWIQTPWGRKFYGYDKDGNKIEKK